MNYSSDLLRNVRTAWDELGGDTWMDIDPITGGLVSCARILLRGDEPIDSGRQRVLSTVRSRVGDDAVVSYTSTSSRGRGRKRKGGIDPSNSVTVRIHLKGDL